MVAGTDDPAVERRRLRVELRKLRLDANLTQRDVADAMDWSTSKLIRIEHGDVRITPNDLKALLDHYAVKDKRRVDSLLDMARTARKESWSEFRDVHSVPFLTYLGYESSAQLIRHYELTFVPGLLQTEEYARAILGRTYGDSRETIEKRWDARQKRQELHERTRPPKMFFVLDQAVVARQVGGPGVMRRQLERLKEWCAAPHISLQVIPFAEGAHPGMTGPFSVLEFPNPGDDDLLYVEHATGEVTTRDEPGETEPYINQFFRLEDAALSTEATLELIDEVIESMGKGATKSEPEPEAVN